MVAWVINWFLLSNSKRWQQFNPKPDLKFPSLKSNCTSLNKWQVISMTRSNKGENLSNCWSTGEKLITFMTGNIKGSDYCYTGDFGIMSGF